jgi:hypothetical protein
VKFDIGDSIIKNLSKFSRYIKIVNRGEGERRAK